MRKKPIAQWFAEHDEYFEDPMRALTAGYSIEEIRDEYSHVYTEKYAEEIFQKDLQILAVRAYNGG